MANIVRPHELVAKAREAHADMIERVTEAVNKTLLTPSIISDVYPTIQGLSIDIKNTQEANIAKKLLEDAGYTDVYVTSQSHRNEVSYTLSCVVPDYTKPTSRDC